MCIYMSLPGVLLFVQLSFWLHGSLLLSGISLVAVSRGCSVVQELLFAVASLMWSPGPRVKAQWLRSTGLVILWPVGSSQTREEPVPLHWWGGGGALKHWTTHGNTS